MRTLRIFLFLLILPGVLLSQSRETDSLKAVIQSSADDTTRVNALVDLANSYGNEETPIAIFYADSAIRLSRRVGFLKGEMLAIYSKGRAYAFNGKNTEALPCYYRALDIAIGLKDVRRIGKCYNNIGIVYDVLGIYDKALQFHLKSLAIKETLKDQSGILKAKINIAAVYYNLKEYEKSLKSSRENLLMAHAQDDPVAEGLIYNNIANIYGDRLQFDSAITNYEKALHICLMTDNMLDAAGIYFGLGQCMHLKGDFDGALLFIEKGDSLSRQMNYVGGIVKAHVNKGTVLVAQKKYAAAETELLSGLKLAVANRVYDDVSDTYENLSELYERTNRPELALYYYKKHQQVQDSILDDNKSRYIASVQESYEIDKREQENKLLQAENTISETAIHQQRIVSYFITAGLVLALSLVFFIFRGYRLKQKANVVITAQKEEVERQKSMVEQKSRLLEEKNKEILDSIHYAKRIQKALLTSDKYLGKVLPEHFVLYKPKDIVSGDFYWSVKIGGKVYVATADCTGHGVPGAFMSLVGISFLSEIILEKKISSPEKILNQLREEIVRALNPEDANEESKDGMDIVLCCYDLEKMMLTFAAANNPLYLVRDGRLIESKADKFPVGKYHDQVKNFNLQSISLQKDDLIYTFTDGFADQFGGERGKKYKYKQLQEKILLFSDAPMQVQKERLSLDFDNWKGELEQVDDILVIGIRIS